MRIRCSLPDIFDSKMAWILTVGFNKSLSVIKSDICFCLNLGCMRNLKEKKKLFIPLTFKAGLRFAIRVKIMLVVWLLCSVQGPPSAGRLAFACSCMSSADFSTVGEVIFRCTLEVSTLLGLMSASGWIMLMLLPCLQCSYFREVQQTHALKHPVFKLTLGISPGFDVPVDIFYRQSSRKK